MHFFAVVLYDYNVKLLVNVKRLSYTFFGGNIVRILVHFVFTAAHFYRELVAASISHFVLPLQNFHVVLPTKKCLLEFASLPPTFSFSLSFLALYSKFVDMTTNLSILL